jgi:hypothetical protein
MAIASRRGCLGLLRLKANFDHQSQPAEVSSMDAKTESGRGVSSVEMVPVDH